MPPSHRFSYSVAKGQAPFHLPVKMRFPIRILVGLALLVAGCAGDPAPTPTEQAAIDRAERFHRAIDPTLLSTTSVDELMQRMSRRITAAAKDLWRERTGAEPPAWLTADDLRFHLVDNPTPNATTAGGRHLYVYTAALERCRSEEDLAALMTHAYAHLLARHVLRNLADTPAEADPLTTTIALIRDRFSDEQEDEAAELAFFLHTRAGWDPLAFAAFYDSVDNGRVAARAREWIDRLPPAAQDWARPPFTDQSRFSQLRATARPAAPRPDIARRLLTALPNCLLPEDQPAQRSIQRELLTPITTEPPPTFEKGPRPR